MPICPKCHKEISGRKFERHLRRCGESHKKEAAPLSAPSATPSFYWGQYRSGYTAEKEQSKKSGHRGSLAMYAIVAVVAVVVVAFVLVEMQVL